MTVQGPIRMEKINLIGLGGMSQSHQVCDYGKQSL